MTKVLGESIGRWVHVYIDDIIIASDSFEEHMLRIADVLNRLQGANLKTNIDKCHFCLTKVKILGKIVTGEGISADPALIQDMVRYPLPESTQQVRSWLALLGHYRSFIKDFTTVAEPLINLTRKGVPLDMNKECQEVP